MINLEELNRSMIAEFGNVMRQPMDKKISMLSDLMKKAKKVNYNIKLNSQIEDIKNEKEVGIFYGIYNMLKAYEEDLMLTEEIYKEIPNMNFYLLSHISKTSENVFCYPPTEPLEWLDEHDYMRPIAQTDNRIRYGLTKKGKKTIALVADYQNIEKRFVEKYLGPTEPID